MRRHFKKIKAYLIILSVIGLVISSQAFATEVTILGEITVDSQIVTEDGEVYEIAETEKGEEVLEHIGKMVEVTGTVEEKEGLKTITVQAFATETVQAFATEVTILGEITVDFQIVTEDGEAYEIAKTEIGDEVLKNIGKMAEVTGMVEEKEGVKTMTVTSYVILT